MSSNDNSMWLTTLRGLVEKLLDLMLTDQSLSSSRMMFESMQPMIKNTDDAVFGYVYGFISGNLSVIFATLHRLPTSEEFEEIVNATSKRVLEIKSRIYQTKT
jgi:hypothetical protein